MRNENPKISVCIPVYNAKDYIENTVACWVNQDFRDLEICISDDDTDDGTWEILSGLAKRDERVHLNRNPSNLGPKPNFRIAHDMARGDYVLWASDDDLYDKTYCSKLLAELEANPDCKLAVSAYRRVSRRDGAFIKDVYYRGRLNPNHLSALGTMLLCWPRSNAAALANGYAHFCMGLFRHGFVDALLRNDPTFMSRYDIKLPAMAAMCGGIRYVDEILVTKRIWQGRDKLPTLGGRGGTPTMAHKPRLKWWYETISSFLRAPMLPWYWKLAVPVVYFPVAFNEAKVMFVQYAYMYASKTLKQVQVYFR